MQKQRVLQIDTGDNNYTGSTNWVKGIYTPDEYWERLKGVNNLPGVNYYPIAVNPYVGHEFFTSDRPIGRYMSDVYHTKSQYRDWHTSDIQTWASTSQYAYRSRERYTNFQVQLRDQNFAVVPEGYSSKLAVPSDFSARAWNTLLPRFEGEISMLNFLYELKDLKPLIKYVSKFNFAKLNRDMRKVLQSVRTDPSKPLAEAHLANEFAIKPMLSDITEIFNQIFATVTSAQNKFSEAGSTNQKRHYSEGAVLDNVGAWCLSGYDSWSTHVWRVMGRRTVTYTATLRYNYKYTQRPGWDAFTRYWGLDLNAEAIWNAIPFSFLVDYFVKIGDSLHAAAHDPNVLLTEYEYCESSLIASMSGILVRSSTDVPYIYVNNKRFEGREILLSGYSGEMYRRVVTEPNKGGLVIPKLANKISVGQLQNMAALTRCFL